MDIKELLPKDTEGRLRIIQETVPGRQITLIVLRSVSSQLPQVNLL